MLVARLSMRLSLASSAMLSIALLTTTSRLLQPAPVPVPALPVAGRRVVLGPTQQTLLLRQQELRTMASYRIE